jgi:hypothetical protein
MPEFHTLVMQVLKTTHLLVADWGIKYTTCIVIWRL